MGDAGRGAALPVLTAPSVAGCIWGSRGDHHSHGSSIIRRRIPGPPPFPLPGPSLCPPRPPFQSGGSFPFLLLPTLASFQPQTPAVSTEAFPVGSHPAAAGRVPGETEPPCDLVHTQRSPRRPARSGRSTSCSTRAQESRTLPQSLVLTHAQFSLKFLPSPQRDHSSWDVGAPLPSAALQTWVQLQDWPGGPRAPSGVWVCLCGGLSSIPLMLGAQVPPAGERVIQVKLLPTRRSCPEGDKRESGVTHTWFGAQRGTHQLCVLGGSHLCLCKGV